MGEQHLLSLSGSSSNSKWGIVTVKNVMTIAAVLLGAGLAMPAKATCLERADADGDKAVVRVAAAEEKAYVALGYTRVECPAAEKAEKVAAQLSYICKLAVRFPKEQWPFFEQRFRVTPDKLCSSARKAGAELGLTLDEKVSIPTREDLERARASDAEAEKASTPIEQAPAATEVRP
jgi:hypothetical protein